MPEPEDSRKGHFGFRSNPMDKLFVSHGGLSSLCFDRDAFFEPSFDVDNFLSLHTQRGIPLEVLKDDLATYRKILQSALVQLIDREYADFVHLSSSLIGIDKNIEKLHLPIQNHMINVQRCLDVVAKHVQNVDAKMQRLASIKNQKIVLQSLLSSMDCFETLRKTDRKISEAKTFQERFPILCRISDLLSRIYSKEFLLSSTTWFASVREQLTIMDSSFTKLLAEDFLLAVKSKEAKRIQDYCLIYQHLNRIRNAYEIVSDGAVKPKLLPIMRNLQQQSLSLSEILTSIISTIEEHFYCLVYVDEADFVLESIWNSIISLLISEGRNLFIPDQPDQFHSNYRSCQIFINDFLKLIQSGKNAQIHTGKNAQVQSGKNAQLQSGKNAQVQVGKNIQVGKNAQVQSGKNAQDVRNFWRFPATIEFLEKWSVPIYYQVRFMEIASPVEESVSKNISRGGNVSNSKFSLEQSEVVWRAVQKCFDKNVCLEELVPRFWKLTLLLLSRYKTFLEKINLEMLSVEFLTEILSDLKIWEIELPKLIELVMPFISVVTDENITKNLSASLEDTSASFIKLRDEFSQKLATNVAKEVGETFKAIQDIPRLYRRTNREVPSTHSAFIDSAFDYLEKILNISPGSPSSKLEQSTVNLLVKHYASLVMDLLDAVRRMEDSLKKLKKTRFVEATASMSDDDKIRLQIYLDALQLERRIQNLNIDPDSLEDFQSLKAKVSSEKPAKDN